VSLPVALLAGGLATRLRPITELIPKALVEVAGRPFVAHQMEWLQSQGVTQVVLLVGYRGEMIRDALGDGSAGGMRFDYVFDGPQLLGTGGALRQALGTLGPAFIVMYGDSYLRCDLRDIERTFEASGRLALMTVLRNDNRWDRSNVLFEHGQLRAYDKHHPATDMRHIDYGLGVLRDSALTRYAANTHLDLAEVYRDLLAEGELIGYEVTERFFEIGSPDGLAETRAWFENRA
jgi:NDP-sugar pyrophosphorylase family protein